MNYFNSRDPYHDDYQFDSRRNSSSGENSGAKRKRTWKSKRRGGIVGTARNTNSEVPIFKEPVPPRMRSPLVSPGRYSHDGGRKNPFRSQGSQHYFDMRDMADFVEPQHMGPSWNWDSYINDCKAWQEKHKLSYYRSRCMALEFENQLLYEQISSLIQENSVFAAVHGEMPTMRLPDVPGRSGWQSDQGAQENNFQTTPKKQGKNRKPPNTSDTEYDFEIDEDMMTCIEESIRHKLSLNKKRSQEASKKKNEDNLTQQEGDSKKQGPKAPVGLKREEELEQLYGKHAQTIQGLETALQLNFIRNCDVHKPEMWMTDPLNPETNTV